MPATFVVVPQWQGSGSSRAMRLVDGAEAIRGDLPAAATRVIDVPLEAGDSQGTAVHRLTTIATVRNSLLEHLNHVTGPVITIGGDCGVELGAIGRVLDQDVAVLWFDAHPDANTPESSETGAFHGMVLRTLLGEGSAQLVPPKPLPIERVVLVGARSSDDAENAYVESSGIRSIGVDDLQPAVLLAAVEATGATSVYIHIDLDVLDPGEFDCVGFPEPFGLSVAALVEAIKAVVARFALIGAGLTEFAPASLTQAADDLPTILRILGALNSGPDRTAGASRE